MSIATIGAFAIGSYEEALGVMLFYRVGELFEHIATNRSRNQIMEAVDLRPEVVHWVKGDQIRTIPAENADIGDILLIRPGDRVPLDGSIDEGESFMDTSAITGEPVPVHVVVGSAVTSGWVNKDGLLKMRVEK
jgi:Cd2+/Zn2+-exporting ATPase